MPRQLVIMFFKFYNVLYEFCNAFELNKLDIQPRYSEQI